MFRSHFLLSLLVLTTVRAFGQTTAIPADTFDDCQLPYTFFYGGDADYTARTLHTLDTFVYVGGSRDDAALLAKMSPAGEVMWVQYMRPFPGSNHAIVAIQSDSEGNLIGCGHGRTDGNNVQSFAFKIDPTDGAQLWTQTYSDSVTTSFTATHIQEIIPGGPYTLLGTADNRPVPAQGCDAAFYNIDRHDGTLAALGIHYHLGNCEGITASTIVGNNLYATGTYSFSNTGVDKLRPAITVVNDEGVLIWSRLYLANIFRDARLYSSDIQQEGDNGLLIWSHGDDAGIAPATDHLWLTGVGILGNAQFSLKLTLPETVISRALLVYENQYIALATAANSNTAYVMRIANTGEVLWAKQVSNLGISEANSPMSTYEDQLYLVGTHSADGRTDAALVRMDLATGNIPSCLPHEAITVDTELLFSVYDGFNALSPYLTGVAGDGAFDTDMGTLVTLPTSCSPACTTDEICDNGMDDDGDGLVDCDDPDVAATCCCLPLPDLQLGPDMEICAGEILVFQLDGFATYSWSPTQGLDCSTCDTVRYTPNMTGYLRVTAATAAGCEASDSVLITVRTPIVGTSATTTLCPGETLVFGTQTIAASGTYFATRFSGPCAATDTLVVEVTPSGTFAQTTLCPTETLDFGGQTIAASGTYFATRSVGLCTLTDTLVVSIAPGGASFEASICPGETLDFDGQTIAAGGIYTQIRNNGSCDVTDTLTVVQLPDASTSETFVVCRGGSALIFGEVATEPGVYERAFTSADGCTATETIVLEEERFTAAAYVFPPCASAPDRSVVYIRIWGNGGPYTVRWNGQIAANNTINGVPLGDHVAEVTSANGCVYFVPFTIRIYMPWQPLVAVFTTEIAAEASQKTTSITQIPLAEAPVVPGMDRDEISYWPLSIAPNPMHQQAVFNIDGYMGSLQLSLYDAHGREVYQTQTQGSAITLLRDHLGSSGVYYYRIQTATGMPITGKLVVME